MKGKDKQVPPPGFHYLEIDGRFHKFPNSELPVNLERLSVNPRYNCNIWKHHERHRVPKLILGGSKPASVCRHSPHSRSRRPSHRLTRQVPHVETAAHAKGYCPRECRTGGQASARKATSELSGDQGVLENPGPLFSLAMRPKVPQPSDNKESRPLPGLHPSSTPSQQSQAPLTHRPLPVRSRPLAASNGGSDKSHGINPASATGDRVSAPSNIFQADDTTSSIPSDTELEMSISYECLLEELHSLNRPTSPNSLRDYTPADEEKDIAEDETDWGEETDWGDDD